MTTQIFESSDYVSCKSYDSVENPKGVQSEKLHVFVARTLGHYGKWAVEGYNTNDPPENNLKLQK